MPNILVWQKTWELGIAQLDAEHREMVRLLNLLIQHSQSVAEYSNAEPTECLQRLTALMDELRHHFAREERFLDAIGYPGIDNHQREHKIQMAEFVSMHRSLTANKVTKLEPEIIQGIKEWFFDHVIAEDRQYATFYFEKYGKPPAENAPQP